MLYTHARARAHTHTHTHTHPAHMPVLVSGHTCGGLQHSAILLAHSMCDKAVLGLCCGLQAKAAQAVAATVAGVKPGSKVRSALNPYTHRRYYTQKAALRCNACVDVLTRVCVCVCACE